VSPWYWWADVNPEKRRHLSLTITDSISNEPSVKFRGIFINDEDWGLQPWAARTFEPEVNDIGPKTYSKVFELILRLKGNLIWPAMHPCTHAFFSYPKNKDVAADYEIVIGSSHAEPMLRNNVSEWDKNSMGNFNYITNKANVLNYWESRVKESTTNSVIYTLGMRGVHDSGMEGVKSVKDAVPLLEQIFKDQRSMLRQYVSPQLDSIPQVFTLYKEVLDVYENGLQVPEDITLIWPDDNYGYIQRLDNATERTRSGGSGVYYHASYWGRPHDYLWLSTTHPDLIREEMTKAYELGARRIWVLNVGDIKPLEYNIQMFMDMAFDISPFQKSSYVREHLESWTEAIFGKQNAVTVAAALSQYYALAFERRPEFMGWSRTEPTTPITDTEYNHESYGDQGQRRIDEYESVEKVVSQAKLKINPSLADAFYELVEYPVTCASLMNKKFLYRDRAVSYSRRGRISAKEYARLSEECYQQIIDATSYYNEILLDGKWKGMMSMKPRNLPVFHMPEVKLEASTVSSGIAIRTESQDTSQLRMPLFQRYCPRRHFIDLFLTAEIELGYRIIPSKPWIKVSTTQGVLTPESLKSEHRIWVEIDWTKAPQMDAISAEIAIKTVSSEFKVTVNVNNKDIEELNVFKGFIESDGYVSIRAEHYNRVKGNNEEKRWTILEGINSRLVEALPLSATVDTSSNQVLKNPSLEYDVFTGTSGEGTFYFYTLPTHPLNKDYGMRYAVQVDDRPVQILSFRTVGRSEEWKENVLRNSAVKSITIPMLKAGKHKITIYMVDPGVILDRIFLSVDGRKPPYGEVGETIVYPKK
jgi:hypothetical protein